VEITYFCEEFWVFFFEEKRTFWPSVGEFTIFSWESTVCGERTSVYKEEPIMR
jgi:hypothetical protein